MTIALRGNATAIAVGVPTSFKASGGTGPYTYSVLSGGAGGTINSSTGMYTAPSSINSDPNLNTDTLKAVDSLGAIAIAEITVMSPLELFCEIIQSEMGLDNGRVYIWDQKIKEPTDFEPYIVVSILNCKPFGNTNRFDSSGNSLQSVNMSATLSVDIKSRGMGALNRKEEIIMALQSDYAQRQQELNGFYIGKISSNFVNLSQEDGAAIPYRFNLSINMQYVSKKTTAVDYYDEFDDDIDIEP